ncbi:hypothetical protein MTO96_042268 [Rhipicephalus appendiculatus]
MYDPGYANYMYGVPTPRTPRRYIIQVPPKRSSTTSCTDNLLTVLIVCGTLFLVLVAMLIIVTVLVPKCEYRVAGIVLIRTTTSGYLIHALLQLTQ